MAIPQESYCQTPHLCRAIYSTGEEHRYERDGLWPLKHCSRSPEGEGENNPEVHDSLCHTFLYHTLLILNLTPYTKYVQLLTSNPKNNTLQLILHTL